MVSIDRRDRRAEHFDSLQKPPSLSRVELHLIELLLREWSGFSQDPIFAGDLSQITKGSPQLNCGEPLRIPAELGASATAYRETRQVWPAV